MVKRACSFLETQDIVYDQNLHRTHFLEEKVPYSYNTIEPRFGFRPLIDIGHTICACSQDSIVVQDLVEKKGSIESAISERAFAEYSPSRSSSVG